MPSIQPLIVRIDCTRRYIHNELYIIDYRAHWKQCVKIAIVIFLLTYRLPCNLPIEYPFIPSLCIIEFEESVIIQNFTNLFRERWNSDSVEMILYFYSSCRYVTDVVATTMVILELTGVVSVSSRVTINHLLLTY